jgi:hypothetical protein
MQQQTSAGMQFHRKMRGPGSLETPLGMLHTFGPEVPFAQAMQKENKRLAKLDTYLPREDIRFKASCPAIDPYEYDIEMRPPPAQLSMHAFVGADKQARHFVEVTLPMLICERPEIGPLGNALFDEAEINRRSQGGNPEKKNMLPLTPKQFKYLIRARGRTSSLTKGVRDPGFDAVFERIEDIEMRYYKEALRVCFSRTDATKTPAPAMWDPNCAYNFFEMEGLATLCKVARTCATALFGRPLQGEEWLDELTRSVMALSASLGTRYIRVARTLVGKRNIREPTTVPDPSGGPDAMVTFDPETQIYVKTREICLSKRVFKDQTAYPTKQPKTKASKAEPVQFGPRLAEQMAAANVVIPDTLSHNQLDVYVLAEGDTKKLRPLTPEELDGFAPDELLYFTARCVLSFSFNESSTFGIRFGPTSVTIPMPLSALYRKEQQSGPPELYGSDSEGDA